jgi:SAM-dependent methyltransferase
MRGVPRGAPLFRGRPRKGRGVERPALCDTARVPVGQSRNAFALEAIRASGARTVLDIGCGPGYLLCQLDDLECTGVDMDTQALAAARDLCPNATIVEQTGAALPFADESFDAVVLSEVIEHVGDENKRAVIDEAHRVLRGGGTFILTAPFAGVTAWADPLDVKRRLPRVYGLYRRAAAYEPQTAAAIGHKHVTDAELRELFDGRFEIEECRYTGPLTVVLLWLLVVAVSLRLPESISSRINTISGWESGIKSPRRLAFSIRLVARSVR